MMMSAKWYLTGSTGVVTVITFWVVLQSLLSTETPERKLVMQPFQRFQYESDLISNRALGNSLNLPLSDNLSMETSANGHTSHLPFSAPVFAATLRSWLRPHRGISQAKLPLYLGFFEFVHNAGSEEGSAFSPPGLLVDPWNPY